MLAHHLRRGRSTLSTHLLPFPPSPHGTRLTWMFFTASLLSQQPSSPTRVILSHSSPDRTHTPEPYKRHIMAQPR